MILLTACGGGNAVAPVGKHTQSNKAKVTQTKAPSFHKVKKGDTLYSISWRYGMNYKTLAKINNIRSPYKIYIGQKLRFKPTKTTQNNYKKKATTSKKITNKKVVKKTTSSTRPVNTSVAWRWPTKGKVISTYSKSAAGRKGIDIAGKSGQQVVSSAAGKVVYSGNGLARYGNLLIIKHNDVYLSAYAHNKKLLVKDGQYVKAGQKIATLGRTGTQRDQLHFEIRRNGKPIDPMQFLPKR
ncbi:MAG: peptidoglycan DD-metalloendopeptidase family protein [Gammaproteobacteria bacterium]|nr:peptidoglycan DD-metalloendopeptidase family protein [Gammaproteobacteria bacterium]